MVLVFIFYLFAFFFFFNPTNERNSKITLLPVSVNPAIANCYDLTP